MTNRGRKGFSLIELVIACSLVSLVLLALVTLSASMVKFQADSIKKGKATGWSIIAASTINQELQDFNVLGFPNSTNTSGDWMCACKNWSRTLNGPIDTTAGTEIRTIYYCLDTTNNLLRRYVKFNNYAGVATNADCPAAVMTGASAPACDGNPAGTWDQREVIAASAFKTGANPVFEYDAAVSGVRVRYTIGNTASTATEKTPQNIPYDFRVALQKSYAFTTE